MVVGEVQENSKEISKVDSGQQAVDSINAAPNNIVLDEKIKNNNSLNMAKDLLNNQKNTQ
ncbi:MAG: hypothetical protein WCP92_01825 [bacterium]